MAIEAAASTADQRERTLATINSRLLRDAVRGAVKRQARRWGIRTDQAQALLLDRRKVA